MSSWRSLILRIGEKCPEYGGTTDFKDHIETCSGVVRRELEHSGDEILSETYSGVVRRELEHSGDEILSFLLQCAEQLPHKIPFYGTMVGLLNLENEEFVVGTVQKTLTHFQDALDSEDCSRIRILLRFLTAMMCSKVIQPSSLVVIYEALLSSAATTVDEEKGNPSWQARADFYITCILSSLPWGGFELVEQVPEEVERIMVGIEAYLRIRRHVSDVGVSVFEEVDDTQKALDEKDFLEDLWGRIQDLANSGWKLESVPRPHLSFEAQLVGGKSHDLAPINCPEQPDLPEALSDTAYGRQKHEAELKYPQRIRRLNIFPETKIGDIQPIDRFVVEEYLLDVLFFLNGCRKECASYMVSLPVPFRYEYLMAETIFSQLLLLPHPQFKPMYYTLVIIDLCKALPGAFPGVVAGAVRALFNRMASMDMECRTRLILWFSQHLSNFQFIWPWQEWAFVLDLPDWAPQRVFVREVLEKESRLSYWEKIKQSVECASGLEALLPPKEGPSFIYSADGTRDKDEHALSVDLNNLVKSRAVIREINSWIEDTVVPAHGFETTLRVVVQTFLNIGSKSFTHLVTVLERYGQAFAKLCPDQDKQVMLIVEVSSFWKNSSQMTAIAIDRMMGYRLISNVAIVRWVFSPENVDKFHTSDRLWEILRNAVNKTYNRISDLRKEIVSLKKHLLSAKEAASKAKADLDLAESKVSLVDGEPVLGENPGKMKRLKSLVDKTKEEEESTHESLQAKEALLARAVDENQALFLTLFKNFSTVLTERLDDAFEDRKLVQSGNADDMAIDLEESPAMDLDKESERPQKGGSNGEQAGNGYTVSEKEQWGVSTLSYVKAFSRQYASEIWPYIERLDAEVLTGPVHPLFRRAVYSGLGRVSNEL